MTDDRRLIEDYLPIEAISVEASREKSIRKGHISTLHLWWARRPLVACRAAVYGALVPASRFVPNGGSDEKKKSLGRANSAKFVKALCLYPGEPRTIEEARRHILTAHADRLTRELAEWKAGNTPMPGWADEFKFSDVKVTIDDITVGSAPRPRVLDLFAGGGSIPLEALRLGCDSYAVELNPVAYIIDLCTLVYPQKFGKPDPTGHGMAGPKNEKGETTWGGLTEEIRWWGKRVLTQVKATLGDLYPFVPDPDCKGSGTPVQAEWFKKSSKASTGYLVPVAYLWTRTVRCKNPQCGATVPLLKRTWLCKRATRYVALKMIAPKGKKRVTFEVVEARSEHEIGFDPTKFSTAGNATCPFCSTVADSEYIMAEGCLDRLSTQLMAVVCSRPGVHGKVYLSPDAFDGAHDEALIRERIESLCQQTKMTVPHEPISPLRPSPNARGLSGLTRYGVDSFGKLFTLRQQLLLLSIASEIQRINGSDERTLALAAYLGLLLGRVANQNCAFTVYNTIGEKIEGPMGDKKVPMVWDFPETNPFSGLTGGVDNALDWIVETVGVLSNITSPAKPIRGDATKHLFEPTFFDAVITDPPYYDNVPYADIADFFYVWLKRGIGHLFREHFSSPLSPKKSEATALASQHGGDMKKATADYEGKMLAAFREAHRVLKERALITVVYAHKTTLGWSTLVDAFRQSGFEVIEAWPIDTEMPAGKVKIDRAMLASSIFLVARKRPAALIGNYEQDVRRELESIVRERVETLWEMGVSGADLVIACVGAGLKAFTKYARVEHGNGEDVPAERFLAEVETAVLEAVMAKLSKAVGANAGQTSLAGLDPTSRFYILWRYTYGAGELDAGEAIIFANGTHVELEGQHSLTQGNSALLEKKKSKYRLYDYTERGEESTLGKPGEDGSSAPVVDALHRLLWLLEHKPIKIPEFLNEAKPNIEQLRLVAQALGGPALSGGELSDVSSGTEQSTLGKLLANWNSVMVGKTVVEDRRTGQQPLFKS